LMVTTLKITEDDFESAIDIATAFMKSGGIVVYPTDTVYGIGGDATSEEVVRRIHEIKGIKGDRPLSVLVSDFSMMEYYCDTGFWQDVIMSRYLPGPYTFIVKKRRPLPASPTETLGIRYPASAFCQALCKKFGRPIITTSANKTGDEPPVRFDMVEQRVLDQVELAIDGGPTTYLSPSMVVDLVGRKVIRKGGEDIDLVEFPER